MSYLFLQPGSGSNNMVLDSKALKCRKKYTCLWKLCKWIVYYVCPCKYYKQKECKMHTICLKSARVSYRKVGQGRNKQRRLLFPLALTCRQGTKKGGTWFSLEQVRPALLNKTIVGMEFILRVFLFWSSWIFLLKYTKLYRTRIDDITIFCGK